MTLAEADSGPACIGRVRELMHAPSSTPSPTPSLDVVLLDIALPQHDGLHALRQLKAEYPRLPVLMLSTYPDQQYAVRCLKRGAAGYLNKHADADELLTALKKAAAGGVHLTPSVAEALAASQTVQPERAPREALSHREFQVLSLLRQAAAWARSPSSRPCRPTPSAPTAPASWRRPAPATTWRWRSTLSSRSWWRCEPPAGAGRPGSACG